MKTMLSATNIFPLRIVLSSLVILLVFFLGHFCSPELTSKTVFPYAFSGFDVSCKLNLLAVLCINIAGFNSLQLVKKHPVKKVTTYFIMFYIFWGFIAFSIFYVFRLPLDLESWIVSGFSVLILKTLVSKFKKIRFKKHYFLLPAGRAQGLDSKVSQVSWELLTSTQGSYNKESDYIVTDLHAKELNQEWEEFLAKRSLDGIPVIHFRHMSERLTGRVEMEHLYENYLGSLQPASSYLVIKRLIDLTLIIMALPAILLIMLITSILIKLEDGGSVFFIQERVGWHNTPFTMYKFRSMTENADTYTTQTNDSRVTKVGKVIRKWRIDEFPQFYNVLKGDMSLIGPRAEFIDFANKLNKQVPFYDYRHIVKPGISGWAQVRHGYATGADESLIKVQHDFYYIKHMSFHLDMIIVLKTIRTLLTGFGSR